MLISKEQLIAGIPATTLRAFLKNIDGCDFDAKFAAEKLGQRETVVKNAMKELIRLGYIRSTDDPRYHPYVPTTLGFALANAKLGKGYSRKAADKALAGLLDRIAQVNADEQYAYQVGRTFLFGSILTDKDPVSDVDVIIDLTPRFTDHTEQYEFSMSRIRKAIREGRPLYGGLYYMWPMEEVYRFLKSRSPILSLHDADQMEILKGTEFREVNLAARS